MISKVVDRFIRTKELICDLRENVTISPARDKDTIDQSIKENHAKRDEKPCIERGTVRGSREVTKTTIIIHDFMC